MNFRELRCLKITDRRLVTELKDFDIRGLPSPEFLFIDMESLIKIPEDFKIGKYISSIESIFSDSSNLFKYKINDLWILCSTSGNA